MECARTGLPCSKSLRPQWFVIPFATTRTERLATGDPRKSLKERYKDHNGYVAAVEQAAAELVQSRFLLQEDADRFISDAKASTVLK